MASRASGDQFFEDSIDDLKELVALQETRVVLLEVFDEVVENEVGALVLIGPHQDLRVLRWLIDFVSVLFCSFQGILPIVESIRRSFMRV